MNLITLAIILLFICLIYLYLPGFLNLIGLHPHYKARTVELKGKKALIITTSQATFGDSTKATGVYASEMTVPYYRFLDNGLAVDLASIKGGKIPIEKMSLWWPVKTPADKRFLVDPVLQSKVNESIPIDDVDVSQYDIIFIAGGWGAAYDLGFSETLGKKLMVAKDNGAVLGSVCHGGLGFLQAKKENGEPFVKDLQMTAVTDKQIRELAIVKTPQHPETELKALGARFESKSGLLDVLKNHVVIDGKVVTGQNQNAGAEVAQRMMDQLESV
jgi:putative intracellular protease/amidase